MNIKIEAFAAWRRSIPHKKSGTLLAIGNILLYTGIILVINHAVHYHDFKVSTQTMVSLCAGLVIGSVGAYCYEKSKRANKLQPLSHLNNLEKQLVNLNH